ncbi:MAG: MFS transporter [Alphaproteobacteria bacterium]|nr:MFS transporter [Alphaproteobacteria bacterium]
MRPVPIGPLSVGLDVLRAGLVLLFPLVDAVWQIYLLIFLLNAGSAAFTPTFQSAIPDVLPDEARYMRALSLSRLAYDLENLLSPTLAALLLTVASFDVLFILNSAGFMISGALVLSTAVPPAVVSERGGGLLDNLTFGIRSYLATPRLRGLLALNLGVATAGAMIIVNTVVYVRDRLGGSETEVAQAMAAAGAGTMAGALLWPCLLDRLSDRLVMLTGGTMLGVGLALGAIFQPGFIGLLAIWLMFGAGSSLVQTPSGRLVRRSSNASDRPAYFSAQFALSHACWLLAYPLAGYLGGVLSFMAAFAILAAVAAASTVVAMLVWPPGATVE